jgi:hypothetical protein
MKVDARLLSGFLALASVAAQCSVSPSGLDVVSADYVNSKLSALDLPYLFLPMADVIIGSLVTNYETPIQFRLAAYHGMSCYNSIAMYHPTALDIWGRGNSRVCTDEFTNDAEKNAHEQLTNAYTFAYSSISLLPETKEGITNVMEGALGLNMALLEGVPDIGTPWGLA